MRKIWRCRRNSGTSWSFPVPKVFFESNFFLLFVIGTSDMLTFSETFSEPHRLVSFPAESSPSYLGSLLQTSKWDPFQSKVPDVDFNPREFQNISSETNFFVSLNFGRSFSHTMGNRARTRVYYAAVKKYSTKT